MTSLPYHILYENGKKKELPVREGPLLLVRTLKSGTRTGIPHVIRAIAFDGKHLEGKTIRVGHYTEKTRTPRINLADSEPLGQNDLESHKLRIKVSNDELEVENLSGQPIEASQFPPGSQTRTLHTEPFDLGRRRLQFGECITLRGLAEHVTHELRWINAEGYHAYRAEIAREAQNIKLRYARQNRDNKSANQSPH